MEFAVRCAGCRAAFQMDRHGEPGVLFPGKVWPHQIGYDFSIFSFSLEFYITQLLLITSRTQVKLYEFSVTGVA